MNEPASPSEPTDPIEVIRSFYGTDFRTSDWIAVEQPRISQFGESTFDADWLHNDPQRAGRESPFGTTIAYGFWTMSLLSHFSRQTFGCDYPPGTRYALNYGFDRVRLLTPVRIGSRVRNHVRLLGVEERGQGRFLVTTENRVEIEGEEKPAMIAHWLFLLVYE